MQSTIENLNLEPEISPVGRDYKVDYAYHSIQPREINEDDILSQYSSEEQIEIKRKQRLLSSLGFFIGKDFEMPVLLNEPNSGWSWDFLENVVRIDPKDLLEKPMEHLRFCICHEGGHRRVTKTEHISLEEWKEPGFAFMMNCIEDPRTNNFVAETYPTFREQMLSSYKENLGTMEKSQDEADTMLGYKPRFIQAGFEYIRRWFNQVTDQEIEEPSDLPEEVKDVVQATIQAAGDSWWRYPSRDEADNGGVLGGTQVDGETMIREYSKLTYEINRNQIWPKFKELIDMDLEDQKLEEFLKQMQDGQGQQDGTGSGGNLPPELTKQLTPEEQELLEDLIRKSMENSDLGNQDDTDENAESGKPINLDNLSESLKEKLRDFIESLPEEIKNELLESAVASLKEFEDSLNSELEGELSENPEEREARGESQIETQEARASDLVETLEERWSQRQEEEKSLEREKEIDSLFENKELDEYHEALSEVSIMVDSLTADLRDVFAQRKIQKYEPGYRSGRRWNVRQRVREKVAGVPLFKTEAREQKESESEEMDYAITLLIDLSGSMLRNNRIDEAFKSGVVLAETLNNLSIDFAISGFQDILLEFKSFDEPLDEMMRKKLSRIKLEVEGKNPGGHNNYRDNDDGEALLEASRNLEARLAKNKFLIVLSDGTPAMDSRRKSLERLDRELREAITHIGINTNQVLIGLGLNSEAVAEYYENSIAGITTEEMVETLSELLREIIDKS